MVEYVEKPGDVPSAVLVGDVADQLACDFLVLSTEVVHSKHVDANLLAEMVRPQYGQHGLPARPLPGVCPAKLAPRSMTSPPPTTAHQCLLPAQVPCPVLLLP